ncbi:RDD family protein [Sulfurimonas sp.]|uniref:RDD family protein n=1 Tax=Sulfurimonas sp. TaxID=2022749 RepID=UPI0025CF547A|nr:RDD family protein [Sulfurimonas sp.]MDD5158086.1 RDD family protein [Sulfurimonas sp.]
MDEEIQKILNHQEMTLAPIKKRATAFFIDEVILTVLLIIAVGDSFFAAKTQEEMIKVIYSFILEYVAIKIFYQAFFVMKYGATIGKIVMKIRVVEIKTLQNPNVIISLNRAIVRIFSEAIYYLGFLWGMLDKNRQAWHDKSAKTLVINA